MNWDWAGRGKVELGAAEVVLAGMGRRRSSQGTRLVLTACHRTQSVSVSHAGMLGQVIHWILGSLGASQWCQVHSFPAKLG